MTDQRELDRLLGAFFVEGTDELADRVIDAALDQIDHTHQRRAWRVPRRSSTMTMPIRLATAAVIGVLAVGGALYLIQPGQSAGGGPGPTPGASASPSQAASTPTPTPAATPTATPTAALTPTSGPTGQMTIGRGIHTATLLADGRVLIAGGFATGQVALGSAELYDPRTGTFSRTGSLTTPRAQHSATLLADGRVLIAGGSNGNGAGGPLASAEVYDPKTGTFTATGPMTDGRAWHTATLLADGRVLVTGGDGASAPLASAEIFDPKSGTFTATGSMAFGGALETATLLSDGRVLVAGGGSSASGLCFASAEIFDPKTGTFSPTASMANPRCGHTATLLGDGRVLMTTGTFNWVGDSWQSSAEIFDPKTGKFSPTGSMAHAPAKQTAALLADGRVLIAGGNEIGDQSLASAELYDPKTGTFGPTGSMADARTLHTATVLADGRVLVTGGDAIGFYFAGPFFASAEVYDPTTGTFSPAGSGG